MNQNPEQLTTNIRRNWTTERPTVNGSYYLSVHPDIRPSSWVEDVEYVDITDSTRVRFARPGYDSFYITDISDPLFDGAQWKLRETPPTDPFAQCDADVDPPRITLSLERPVRLSEDEQATPATLTIRGDLENGKCWVWLMLYLADLSADSGGNGANEPWVQLTLDEAKQARDQLDSLLLGLYDGGDS